jgi:hypothetical protein
MVGYGAIYVNAPVQKNSYCPGFKASDSASTGAMVRAEIERRNRVMSFRQ